MIKLFRKIRYNLLNESKTTKYFKYAIGEIILVVFGILIALQINNWNSFKQDRQVEKYYLGNFLVEMRADSTFLNGYWARISSKKIEGLQLARQYQKDELVVNDTVAFLTSIGIGGALSRTTMFENKSTYTDIISTGNIRLIQDENIRNQLLNYYGLSSNTVSYMENLRTEYATFLNSVNPYDPRRNFKPDHKDYERALEQMKSDAFLALANGELTYAYSLNNRLDNVNVALLQLMELIKSDLIKMN